MNYTITNIKSRVITKIQKRDKYYKLNAYRFANIMGYKTFSEYMGCTNITARDVFGYR